MDGHLRFAPSHAVHSGVLQTVDLAYRCGGSVGIVIVADDFTDFPFKSANDCSRDTSSSATGEV